jgi:FkbM family methyltransferase
MLKTIDGRWGPITFFEKDQYVGRSLWYLGEYGPDETEKILELADPDRLCLDIGANIGVITQALLWSGHKVVAFEPQTEVYKLLKKNCRGAEVVNAAVGSTKGTATMPKLQYSVKNNFGGISLNMKSAITYPVDVVAIDDFRYENVGFIKLDVEGWELEALKGMVNTIGRCRPTMYIEDDRPEKSRALREFITSLGYKIEEHNPALYRQKNFFKCTKSCWDRNYISKNIICTPC